jgi:hypothetical protein
MFMEVLWSTDCWAKRVMSSETGKAELHNLRHSGSCGCDAERNDNSSAYISTLKSSESISNVFGLT